MVPHFNKQFNKLKQVLELKNSDFTPKIKLEPLVCDIENDIPGVIDNFCNGSKEFFFEQVTKSSQITAEFFKTEYQNVEINCNTFTSLIGSELLQSKIDLVTDYMQQGLLPIDFFLQAQNVAKMRAKSISMQYGKDTLDEQYQMALRHMTSYLGVSLSLAEKFPEGCLVFNNNSPNLYYVKSTSKMKKIFNIPDSNLPIFIAT